MKVGKAEPRRELCRAEERGAKPTTCYNANYGNHLELHEIFPYKMVL